MYVDERHLERLRQAEVEMVKFLFRPGLRVLEIGGGNGFQAAILASWGCEVASIDISPQPAGPKLRYPVQKYDGMNIPFQDHSFDIVFSSNVLEHIPQLDVILKEVSRVVMPTGLMIHVLPSSHWRFWTILSHYPYLLKELFSLCLFWVRGSSSSLITAQAAKKRNGLTILKRVLLSGPHGEYPSAIHELYAFSEGRWLCTFKENSFEVVACFSNELFYTGYALLPSLSLSVRRAMARLLGSSARIYVMQLSS